MGKMVENQPFLAKETLILQQPLWREETYLGNPDFPTNQIQPFHHRCWVSSKSCGARRLAALNKGIVIAWTSSSSNVVYQCIYIYICVHTSSLVLSAIHSIITLRTSYDIMPPPNFMRNWTSSNYTSYIKLYKQLLEWLVEARLAWKHQHELHHKVGRYSSARLHCKEGRPARDDLCQAAPVIYAITICQSMSL